MKRYLFVILVLLLVFVFFVSLATGPASIPLTRIFQILTDTICGVSSGTAAGKDAFIILDARLPRIICAVFGGACLAAAGLASQTLFRNPLASPYVTGISSGAAVAAVLAMLCAGRYFVFVVPFCSVFGGLTAAFVNFRLSRNNAVFRHAVLLNGIALNAACSAVISLALYIADERLQSLVFWLMGGFWKCTWTDAFILMPLCFLFYIFLFMRAPAMDISLLGERGAVDTGVDICRLQRELLFAAALVVSVCVSIMGIVGFIGLIVPHVLRMSAGAGHRKLVPLTFLGGAFLMLVSDTLARSIVSPAELPVGIISSIAGAPVLFWLLNRKKPKGVL